MTLRLPTVPPGRLVGLDVARCLALVGMIATHTLVSTAPDGGVSTVQAIAGGRASALFAVLAGVSTALMTGRSRPLSGRPLRAAAAGLAARAGFVAAIGLLLGGLDTTVAVILTSYGVLFCLGLPFLGLRARTLAGLALVWAVLAPVLSQLLRPLLPPRGYDSPSLAGLADLPRLLGELLLTGYYPAVVWLAYLLAGMALGRLELRRTGTAVGLLLAGAGTAALAWAVSSVLLEGAGVRAELARTFTGPAEPGGLADTLEHGLYGSTPTGSWWWLAVHAPHSGTPFDLLHTGGCAVAAIGACLLLARLAPATLAVVFGAGTMTLTTYSLHVVLRTPWAWPDDDAATFARHVLLVLAIGAAFRLLGRSGPLERVAALLAGSVRRSVLGPQPDGIPVGAPERGVEPGVDRGVDR
ncbi:heparan-alpha-glucosaminide N-acetyltransferase domain-containing protein [Nocardioides mesophilus]|uniref:DUF1624 domain-containing protein n=1 Tax=Nocardioides mesophilus TaxID=433659 RepID=A0A7G9RF07_9ACTN|nr:heparan-alpha-glucosaminide N-acetyltransferase domain-containing protein [Nocardioides mesophilus]QNN54182.1 DUF1624 domain-containing protein [Nocardioides mesophilus]